MKFERVTNGGFTNGLPIPLYKYAVICQNCNRSGAGNTKKEAILSFERPCEIMVMECEVC